MTGVSIMGTGIQTERVAPDATEHSAPGLEEALAALGDLLAERGTGLLVTVDEMHVSRDRRDQGVRQCVPTRVATG